MGAHTDETHFHVEIARSTNHSRLYYVIGTFPRVTTDKIICHEITDIDLAVSSYQVALPASTHYDWMLD